jgi:hypothetical protein
MMATRKYRKWTDAEKEAMWGPRPICTNPGCGRPCTSNGKRWVHFCNDCRNVSQGRGKAKAHIQYSRKNMCANYDGRVNLGFSCYTNWELIKKENGQVNTHMDHIDGNHLNNTPANLQELCPYCHDRKSAEGKDKDGWKNRREMKGREAIDLQVLFTV